MIQGVNLCIAGLQYQVVLAVEHEHDHNDDEFGAEGMDWDDCFAILMEDKITTI